MTSQQIIKKYIPNIKNVKVDGRVIQFELTLDAIIDLCKNLYLEYKLPLKTTFAIDDRKTDSSFKIFYIFGIPKENYFLMPFIRLENSTEFPSMASSIHELTYYEREIYTFFGLTPIGYPSKLQPLILHDNWPKGVYPLRKDFKWNHRPAHSKAVDYTFEVIEGEGIYELPVGPIHAGIIEPGHFRFSLAGEEIVNLEPQLGYVHKGIEKLFENLPLAEKVRLSERVSGDSSFNHSLAFCQALEQLSDINVPERANYLRVIFAELERLANHFNDIGFIMLDTAFTFGGSQCARLREVVMQLNERLTGSRYFRGTNIIGGVTKDISKEDQITLIGDLRALLRDFSEVIDISQDSTSMMNRLNGSGILDKQIGIDHGVVGIAARALGIPMDARLDYPYAAYPRMRVKIAQQQSGDVLARFKVRIEEVYNSFQILESALEKLSSGPIASKQKLSLHKNSEAVGIVEGWRGDIVYVVITDEKGEITRVAVRDPSFLNWPAVPFAVTGNPVPEFPLINKSFNLSYSGNDR